jgi:hypothetical protein
MSERPPPSSQLPVDPDAKPPVETSLVSLVGGGWTDLGPGPLHIWSRSQAAHIVYVIGDEAPGFDPGFGFPLQTGIALTLHTKSHIWVSLAPGGLGDLLAAPL